MSNICIEEKFPVVNSILLLTAIKKPKTKYFKLVRLPILTNVMTSLSNDRKFAITRVTQKVMQQLPRVTEARSKATRAGSEPALHARIM